MSLSIIIPCLDEEDEIVAALAALGELRSRGAEVIVVDGGSSDNTVERARTDADLVVEAARSRAGQMNAGAARARGDVLLFLHADTRLPARADDLIARGLATHGRSWGRFDVAIGGTHPLFSTISAAMNWRSRVSDIATGDQAIFVTRTLFERAGKFPEIRLMEDIAFTATLRRFERPLCLSQRVTTSGRRWQKHGILRTIALMWTLRFAYWLGVDPDKLAAKYAPHKAS